MKQSRAPYAALILLCVAAGCSDRGANPTIAGPSSVRSPMVTYQGGLGSGTGKYDYKDPGTGKTCSGTASYTIGTLSLDVSGSGKLVRSGSNEIELVATKFTNCKLLAANYGFTFKPTSGSIDATGEVSVKAAAVSGGCCTGSATLSGTLSDSDLILSGYKTYGVTLESAKIRGIKLFK
jgi:hypothetical protein